MQVEFDPTKAATNWKKHGVSFDEAAGSLLDPMALVREDDEAIRLISARESTRREEQQYAQGI
jgi:uncharacterized DUF497 family protein